MTSLQIQRVDSWPELCEWQAVCDAAQRHDLVDLPCDPAEDFRPLLEEDPYDESFEFWLGRVDGTAVAAGRTRRPLLDNLETASVELQVLPEHRRQQHGTSMLRALTEHCRTLGRRTVYIEIPGAYDRSAPATPRELFARAAGAHPVTDEVRYRLVLDDIDVIKDKALEALDGRLASITALSPRYRTVSWVTDSPPELVADLARLAAGMSTDAPLGEIKWEPENWSPERFVRSEQLRHRRGRRLMGTAAVDTSTGRAVGVTAIGISSYLPEIARQGETIVAAAHRGHRLGLRLKLVNLRHLIVSEPRARVVITWNAEENHYMTAINEQLGFTPVERWREWQLDL